MYDCLCFSLFSLVLGLPLSLHPPVRPSVHPSIRLSVYVSCQLAPGDAESMVALIWVTSVQVQQVIVCFYVISSRCGWSTGLSSAALYIIKQKIRIWFRQIRENIKKEVHTNQGLARPGFLFRGISYGPDWPDWLVHIMTDRP